MFRGSSIVAMDRRCGVLGGGARRVSSSVFFSLPKDTKFQFASIISSGKLPPGLSRRVPQKNPLNMQAANGRVEQNRNCLVENHNANVCEKLRSYGTGFSQPLSVFDSCVPSQQNFLALNQQKFSEVCFNDKGRNEFGEITSAGLARN